MVEIFSDLMGEPAVLFTEKVGQIFWRYAEYDHINFKAGGSGGFDAHIDTR